MKSHIKHFAVLFLATMLLAACQRNIKYPYAIRDFDAEVQPLLERLATLNILNNNWDVQQELVEKLSSRELQKLSKCDVPLLRAFAMQTLIERNKEQSAKMDIAFTHLDDTACVDIDWGEFGICRSLVSDHVLNDLDVNKIDSVFANKLIRELLTNRSYLRETYSSQTERAYKWPDGYQLIRNMVENNYRPAKINEPIEGGETEIMLLRLAAFQRPTDTTLIRVRLEEYFANWGQESFSPLGLGYLLEILKKYPHTEYAVPISMVVDLMIRHPIGMDEDDFYDRLNEYDVSLNSYFVAIAAIKNNHGKQQLGRLLRHYEELAAGEESRLQNFGKEALSKLKSFIAKSDYADYKSLLL